LPKKLPPALLSSWTYLGEESKAFHAQDRSSIYGGFHVYARRKAS
jgi:S-adenosylmethionine-diacylglycerol 3-amino-3-carboxypropyl transferase